MRISPLLPAILALASACSGNLLRNHPNSYRQGPKILVVAPKKEIEVGEKIVLSASLPKGALPADRAHYKQSYFWNLSGGKSFKLGLFSGEVEALAPNDTALVCARLWYTYVPGPGGIQDSTRTENVRDGCVLIVSRPAKK